MHRRRLRHRRRPSCCPFGNGAALHFGNHFFIVLGGGGGLDKAQHRADLLIGHKGALHTHGLGRADGQEEHITVAQQLFGTAAVQNGAAVDLAGNGKGDTAGDVGLDKAGDDVHAGSLGRNDQVDAGSAGLLRDAADIVLDFLARDHHQVGQLVNDDGDIGRCSMPVWAASLL